MSKLIVIYICMCYYYTFFSLFMLIYYFVSEVLSPHVCIYTRILKPLIYFYVPIHFVYSV